MKAETFDKMFDDGEDISHLLDLSSARRPNQEQKRVNVDFPQWMVDQLDSEVRRVGVTRQSIIKVWLADRVTDRTSLKALEPGRQPFSKLSPYTLKTDPLLRAGVPLTRFNPSPNDQAINFRF